MDDVSGQLALSAQLSHVLVAFTVELDNEFEHQMPHRTTMHGSAPGTRMHPGWSRFRCGCTACGMSPTERYARAGRAATASISTS